MNNRILFPSGGPLTLVKLALSNGGIHPSRTFRFLISLLRLSLTYPYVLWERIVFGRRIHNVKIDHPPVFIIGHFRSGTSLMHKLLSTDPRWRYINEYELIFPHHGIQIQKSLKPWIQRFISHFQLKHPNFNNYLINLDDPNEDEALLTSSGASWASYWSYIFPRHAQRIIRKTIQFGNERDKEEWKSSYLFFLKHLLWKQKGRLLIKSPPSTGRVGALLELFPDAKFIYMHRDRAVVMKSMQKIWHTEILPYFCLQKPDDLAVRTQIAETYEILISLFQQQKSLVPTANLVEVSYEYFKSNSKEVIEDIYRGFNIQFTSNIAELMSKKIQQQKDYTESKY